MSRQPPTGPFCQSCAMPLAAPEDFGSDARGHRVTDYCRQCFRRGAFTEPWMSMQGMIDRTVAIMVQQGMPQAQAMSVMIEVMPKLKRWQEARRGQPGTMPRRRTFRPSRSA